MVGQALPFLGRVPQAKMLDLLLRQPALFQISPGVLRAVCGKLAVVKQRRLAQRLIQALLSALFLLVGPAVLPGLRQGQAGLFRQKLHGFGKCHLFHVHDKVDDIAALMAAKAIVKLLVRVYGKRGRLFAVERAAAPVAPAFLLQRHILRNNLHQIVARPHFV